MERRVLRRAADQALLTSMAQHAGTTVQPGGPADRDFEYKRADPVDTGDVYEHEPTTEPIPVADVEAVAPPPADDEPAAEIVEEPARPADVYDLVPEHADPVEPELKQFDDRQWDEFGADTLSPVEPQPLRARPLAESYVAPHLDFAMSEREPWYRTKPVAVALVAAVVVAVLGAGWLVLRSPSTTAEQPMVATTSVPPAPTSATPTAANAPMPPPAPPPPPPPPAPPPPPDEPVYSGPQQHYSPQHSESTPAEKPRIDVTRTPMSVAPVPKPVLGSDHNIPSDTPGQQPRRHGCFGFC
jgi:hypothetical protein